MEHSQPNTNPHTQPADAVIALGKNWRLPVTGVLSLESKLTALAAGMLYVQGKTHKIIFSTGKTAGKDRNGQDYPTEAFAMCAYLRILFSVEEIPSENILLEEHSFDTAGNAQAMRAMLEKESLSILALLTVGFHLPRSLKLFHHYGVSIQQSFASEQIVKARSPHHNAFVQTYLKSGHHFREVTKEGVGLSLVHTVDPHGHLLRIITLRSRNRK